MKYIKEFICVCLLCEPEGSLQVGGQKFVCVKVKDQVSEPR